MSQPFLQAICPHCQKSLRAPAHLAGKSVKCKHCGQRLNLPRNAGEPSTVEPSAAGARPGTAEATTHPRSNKAPLNERSSAKRPILRQQADSDLDRDVDEDPVELIPLDAKKKLRRINPAIVMPIVFLFVLLVAGGVLWVVFGDDLRQLWQAELATDRPPTQTESLLDQAAQQTRPEGGFRPSGPEGTRPRGPSSTRPGGRTPPLQTSRFSGPFPGRALLIGIKNYLYLQPLNPNYAPDLTRDPLGLHGLKRALIEDTAFRKDQVLELSDVAQEQPIAPTKAVLEATIKDFLEKSRPQDRVILVFVGHVGMVKEQGYLFPIDAEMDAVDRLISIESLLAQLGACPARQKLLIIDPSPFDPDQMAYRPAPDASDAKFHELFKKAPEGVQVWLACQPGQQSHLPYKHNTNGSAFIHWLTKVSSINNPEYWRLIEKHPALKDEPLPMLLMEQTITGQTHAFVKEKLRVEQTPVLLGKEVSFKGTKQEADPIPLTVQGIIQPDAKADARLLDSLLNELSLINDPHRTWKEYAIQFQSLKLDSRFTKDGTADFKTLADLRSRFKDKPVRLFCLEIAQQLNKKEDFRMTFTQAEVNNKRLVETLQQAPASAYADLMDLVERAKELESERDKESPRWQAHYDYYHARLLGKTITVSEYNFVLGNSIRKDSPTLQDPRQHDGWVIIPQERLQQSDSRGLNNDRKKILERMIKDYPQTPWEWVARSELATFIGLKLHETKLRR